MLIHSKNPGCRLVNKINKLLLLYFLPGFICLSVYSRTANVNALDTIIVREGFIDDRASCTWLEALKNRLSQEKVDSISRVRKAVTTSEKNWKQMIELKAIKWNSFRDSLSILFPSIKLDDSIYILTGYGGNDDGFTYGLQTVCLDLTALQREYGSSDLPENDSRIDRIFAHEYTHLLHKAWAVKTNQQLLTFKDSILWECLYEGLGMYRSFSARWLPVQRKLPDITVNSLGELYPVFSLHIKTVTSGIELTPDEKKLIGMNLSRGSVNKKWGAFPVGIWLALEANGDDQNLVSWIEMGPEAVIELSKKYIRE